MQGIAAFEEAELYVGTAAFEDGPAAAGASAACKALDATSGAEISAAGQAHEEIRHR